MRQSHYTITALLVVALLLTIVYVPSVASIPVKAGELISKYGSKQVDPYGNNIGGTTFTGTDVSGQPTVVTNVNLPPNVSTEGYVGSDGTVIPPKTPEILAYE